MIYSTLIGILLFIIYIVIVVSLFGIPPSLSDTFYLYQNKQKGFGYTFTGVMFILSLTLMPGWIEITEIATNWSQYLTVFPFIGGGAIAFVGAAPAFKNIGIESKVHTISAICAAIFSLMWCCIVCYDIIYILPISLILIAVIAHTTKTHKNGKVFWLEMLAFLTTFTCLIVKNILLL